MTHAAAASGDWPTLAYEELEPTIEHLRRLVQVGAKYTLDQLFEPSWGNIVLNVTGRGLATPTLRVGGVTFTVHYRLLDNDVVLEADSGERTLPLGGLTVGAFYEQFVAATASLGIPPPGSTIAAEIPDAAPLDLDSEDRTWEPSAARLIWQGFNAAADALGQWQAPYRAHRPRVGVMWGGFDLSATRYRATPVDPPSDRPMFMQNGMAEEVVAVGFSFGSPDSPQASFYAYIAPEPPGVDKRNWSAEGAQWVSAAGLAVLPWDIVRRSTDPVGQVIAFADAVYAAAVDLGQWPPDLTGERRTGWDAGKQLAMPRAV